MADLLLVPKPELDRLRAADVDPDAKLALLADACRLNALVAVKRAGSGHLGSTFSALDVMAHLLFDELDVAERGFHDPDRDVFFSSKGHDVPGLYAALFALGVIPQERLLRLRRLGGLDGHPDVGVPGIEANTGSLGMGISKGRGIALAKRRLGRGGRVVVMTGDGELQEGQNWEALQAAAHERLGRLWVVVDRNEVQSDKPTEEIVALGDLEGKLRAFGWHVLTVDGHDHVALRAAFDELRAGDGVPKALVARTVKGKGVSFMEHPAALAAGGGTYRWHAGAPADEPFALACTELTERLAERCAALGLDAPALERVEVDAPAGNLEGEPESGAGVRDAVTDEYVVEAYGRALLELGRGRDDLVVLDADLASDCRTRAFELAFPERFVQCGIAEQDMVSTAAGMARHGLLPVVNSFASFLASRANEQIYNQASERSKVVYALHYAGLVPAGPGKSHQSVRDISLLGALPNVVLVQPGSSEETEGLVRWAVEEARGDRRHPARDRPLTPAHRADAGDRRRPRNRPARGSRRRARLLRPGHAPRGASRGRAAGRGRGTLPPRGGHAVAQPLRRGLARHRGVFLRPRLRPGGPRPGRRPRRRAAARVSGGGRHRVRRRGLAGVRHTGRSPPRPRSGRLVARRTDCRARRPPSRQSRLARRSMTERRAWVVLPDLLSIRVFFDTGIVDGLDERLDGRLVAVFLVSPNEAAEWKNRVPGLSALGGETLTAPTGLLDRARGRVDAWLDRRAGYHPLAIRLNYRHGFHTERMEPGHPNWMLDTDRDGPLPRWARVERMMERWYFSARRHVPSRLLDTMRRECSGLVLSNVQPASAVPFLAAARRLRLPVVAHVASWDHTVGKGVISPYCDRYIVQNSVMESDLRRYHGIAPERVRVTGWPQTDLFHRRRARTEYDGLLRAYGLDPLRPVVLVAGNTPSNAPYEGRFVERLVEWRERESRGLVQLLFRPHPRDREWRERFSAATGREGAAVQEPSYTDLEKLATLLQHVDVVVCNAGTILLDALVCDRPVVCVLYDEGAPPGESWAAKNVVGRHYDELAASGAFYRADQFDEVVSGIEGALERPEELAVERHRAVANVVGAVDGRAAARVVDAVTEILGEHRG